MSIYQNIFHYYRGQTRNGDEETKMLQIENNVTKAFLNVLQHSSPTLTSNFISFLGINLNKNDWFEYRHQVNNPLTEVTNLAVVLGIAERKEIKNSKSQKLYNIPDGAILSKEISILIENKIGYNSYLDSSQLEGHKKSFAENQHLEKEPIILTWSQLRGFFSEQFNHFKKKNDTLTCFLLSQFEEFCNINCLGDQQKSKAYYFLKFEKLKARNLAKQIDDYIWNTFKIDIKDAGTRDGIGYKRNNTNKFATLTTARQRCLILHIGTKEEKLGLKMQEEVDELLNKKFDRKEYEYFKYPHEAYIRLEWVKDFKDIKKFIDFAYGNNKKLY